MSSSVIDFELSKLLDAEKLENVRTLYDNACEHLHVTQQVEQRATFFQAQGVKPFDSLHLAVAEIQRADVFLTTDNQLLRAAKRLDVGIRVENPVTWLMEVTQNAQ